MSYLRPLLRVVCALVALGPASALVAAESGSARDAVIDMHCHIAGIGAGDSGCFISKTMRKSLRFQFFLRSFEVGIGDVEFHGDGVLVERTTRRLSESRSVGKAVVLAFDGVVDATGELDREKTEMYVPNDYVASQVAKRPGLLFGASINPLRSDAIERLDRAASQGAVLVKWLPAVQDFDPSDKRFIPFYRRLVELGMPLLVHTGRERSFTRVKEELSDPELLRLPLSLGVTVIAAHAAANGRHHGEADYGRLCRLMKEYPNLYADISSLTQVNKYSSLQRVLRQPEMQGRLVYGSDYPLISMPSLTSPIYFAPKIGWRKAWNISRIKNPWDRDVALKQALGVPEALMTRAGSVIRLERGRTAQGLSQNLL